MTSPLQTTMFNGVSEFYNGVATQSVRLAGDSSLTRANADAGTSTKIATISCWFKRTELSVLAYLLHSKNDSGGASFGITLDADDSITVTQYDGTSPFNANNYDFGVTVDPRKFRDTSAWYHLVVDIDTTEAAEADRIKIYINGTRQTVVATTDGSGLQDFADEDQTLAIFQDGDIRWGGTVDDSAYAHIYLAECNGVDGLSLGPSNFGETKNGVWIPKAPTVSEYGNHGFRLQYLQAGVGSAGTGTIGADTSGKGNHFTSATIAAHDVVMPDSPENNFATYNPLQIASPSAAFFLSDGNLALTATNNDGYRNCSATFSPMGFKGYIEFVASAINHKIGIIVDATHPAKLDYGNSGPQHVTLEYNGEVKFPNNGTSFRSASDHNLGTFSAGDVMAMAFDFTGTNRNVWFARANTYGTASGGVGNPATGANPIVTATQLNSTGPYRFHFGINNGPVLRINFGQDGTFGGTETAQGNTDDNGIGDFYYDVPSGFLAMCSANLPEVTIGPNSATQADDYFNTVLYTGNGVNSATGQDISGVGFKPDWLWIKRRDAAASHNLRDSTRGVLKHLQSDITDEEDTESDVGVTAFLDDGFRLLGTNGGSGQVNANNGTFVAWNWKANGGTATATISESGNNPAAVVQANPTAGFSIITYTGTGADGTIAHGLSAKPAWYFVKNRDVDTHNWLVWHEELATNGAMSLNLQAAAISASARFTSNEPTTSVINLGSDGSTNANGEKFIAYVFAAIEGYSKFGSYTGNGAADGPFVFTGFRPAFLIAKRTDANGYWAMWDTVRDDDNAAIKELVPNDDDAETEAAGPRLDILSNGFKLRNSGAAYNASGSPVIYMAFAEAPFKYANAR